MYKRRSASSVAGCTMLLMCSQSVSAQSPPSLERNRLIWSDRDMSLGSDVFTADPQTETSLRWPQLAFPHYLTDSPQEQQLICEPGQPAFTEIPPAAYAEARRLQEGT